MREFDIREALRAHLQQVHACESGTAIIDELGVCRGTARVDMAVVNGSLHGYEIKSDRDRLNRLPRQVDYYGRCFDTMTLVTAARHLDAAVAVVPAWWGVVRPVACGGRVVFERVREARRNHTVSAEAVVQLLWKEETISILETVGAAAGLRSKTRWHLWAALVSHFSPDDLAAQVRAAIKSRGDWRSDQRRARGSGSSPTSASPPHSQTNLDWLLAIGSGGPPR